MSRHGCFVSFAGASFTPQSRSVAIGLGVLEPDQIAALEACIAAGGRVDFNDRPVAVIKRAGDEISIEGLLQNEWRLITSSTVDGMHVLTEAGMTKAVLVGEATALSKFRRGESTMITDDLLKRALKVFRDEEAEVKKLTPEQQARADFRAGLAKVRANPQIVRSFVFKARTPDWTDEIAKIDPKDPQAMRKALTITRANTIRPGSFARA